LEARSAGMALKERPREDLRLWSREIIPDVAWV